MVDMPYWRLFYHFIWGSKNRDPLIASDFETSLHNIIAAKAQALGAFVHAIGGVEDHVHLVVSIPPKISLSDFVGQIKGNSSHWVKHENELDYTFAWQAEFGVISFRGKDLKNIVRYAENQRKHHGDGSVISALERVEDDSTRPGLKTRSE